MADSMDEATLTAQLERLAAEANRRCGLSYDLFVEKFSAAVDGQFPPGSPLRSTALALARPQGYASEDERAQSQADLHAMGYCSHGIDRDCCPAGCGDIDDDFYEPAWAGEPELDADGDPV